ncbi:MAG TPA: baseplate J/gp47 family protein [Ktedonobacteraceae bacterium]
MADEQIIYLSPEEELTNVRERLEQAPARRIILVIPPQTHLRSHVGWRVLHARMREVGKDVLIISSDRQVRAVAKAVGFRVADSLESPSSNRSRPPSRPGRSTAGVRPQGSPLRGRSAPSKGSAQSPSAPQRQQPSRRNPDQPVAQPPQIAPVDPASTINEGDNDGPGGRDTFRSYPGREEAESKISSADEGITGKGSDFVSSTFGEDDYQSGQSRGSGRSSSSSSGGPFSSSSGRSSRSSSGGPSSSSSGRTSSSSGRPQGSPLQGKQEEYNFRIETSQPVSPRFPAHDDEDFPDSLIDQYNQAQRIRQQFQIEDLPSQANRQKDDASPGSSSEIQDLPGKAGDLEGRSYGANFQDRQPAFGQRDEDPYALYMEDIHHVSLPEQRGSAPIEDIDAGVPDLSDMPTDILEAEIEDLGDEGDIMQPHVRLQDWDEPLLEEPERPLPPPVYGSRSRGRRSSNLRPSQPLQEPDIDDEDMLPPVTERQTLVQPPSQERRSGTLTPAGASNRGPQPNVPPQTRNGQAKPSSQQVKKPVKKGRVVTTSPQVKNPAVAARTGGQRRNNGKTLAVICCLLALFLILVGLFIFVPNAQITISLPSRPLTAGPLHFSASMNVQDKASNTVASQVLSYDKSVTGQGNATGTRQVGNSQATGYANFTNRGTAPVDIPTGTVLSTSNGVQFATAADGLIPQESSHNPNPPVPVQAVLAGNNGNVAAGSITVIPSNSLMTIAQNNNVSVSSLNLSVTNLKGLNGGGTSPAASVTTNDITVEKKALDGELQADATTWLAGKLHTGDIQGTPVQTETVKTSPEMNQVSNDGKFSETLHLHMTVLVIRAGALSSAAATQLNAMALKMRPAYMLVAGQPVTFPKLKSTASKDGSSISISLNATGQIVQRVSVDDIRNTLVGKTISQARSDISNGLGGLHGVQNPTIVVSPGFLTILPFRADHITIILRAVSTTPPPSRGVPQ